MPEYAAVKPQGKGLMVASEKPFVCTHVDGCPVEQPDPEPMEVEKPGGSELLIYKCKYCDILVDNIQSSLEICV